jgi:hypothetical protein
MLLNPVMGWSFAATARGTGQVRGSLKASEDYILARYPDANEEQMDAAIKAIDHLLSTGLWGSGPFSLALSGTDTNLYLSVVSQ